MDSLKNLKIYPSIVCFGRMSYNDCLNFQANFQALTAFGMIESSDFLGIVGVSKHFEERRHIEKRLFLFLFL